MLKRVLSTYRPKIQFKKGNKSRTMAEAEVETKPAAVYEYSKPLYLIMRKKLSDEDINTLNQGGVSPRVSWKKVSPLTDIRSPY